MDFHSYLKLLSRKKQAIIFTVIIFMIISVLASFLQPFKYSTEAKLLVVQKFTPGLDPYNMTKSNEYLAEVLAEVIGTNSFFIEVMNAGFDINQAYFPEDSEKQLKEWNKTVNASAAGKAGIINVAVYHKDKSQSDQIMRAIIQTIKAKHTEYHGSGENVELRVIDQPVTSNLPVKPDFIMNLFLGLAIGLLVSLSYVYLAGASTETTGPAGRNMDNYPDILKQAIPQTANRQEQPRQAQAAQPVRPAVMQTGEQVIVREHGYNRPYQQSIAERPVQQPAYQQSPMRQPQYVQQQESQQIPQQYPVGQAAPYNLPVAQAQNGYGAAREIDDDLDIPQGNMKNIFGQSNLNG